MDEDENNKEENDTDSDLKGITHNSIGILSYRTGYPFAKIIYFSNCPITDADC